MILGVIEGQIRGGYFPDCILDPSVVDPSGHSAINSMALKHFLCDQWLTNGEATICPIMLVSGERGCS